MDESQVDNLYDEGFKLFVNTEVRKTKTFNPLNLGENENKDLRLIAKIPKFVPPPPR
jgi:hypothetical protein